LTSELNAPDTAYELELLQTLLESAACWLDVACGTGYFLRRFPHVKRTGIDLSPAMLDIARASTPGAEFIEQNYLDERAEWVDAFDLVSCMWYAYCLVESVTELHRLIRNLAAWTGPNGTCFLPLADPSLITGLPLQYRLQSGGNAGEVTLTGIIWNYSEDDGTKVHADLIAPQVEVMVERFERHFDKVTLVRYPPTFPGWTGRPAIIAQKKRPVPCPP
jgi:SAM-dependent methyltransferase